MKRFGFIIVAITAIACGSDPVASENSSTQKGEKGEAGQDGKSCTVTTVGGLHTQTCPNGSTVSWQDGEQGPPGTDGIDGKNGADGKSCSVTKTDTTATITCPDGSKVTWTLGSTMPATCVEGTTCAAPAMYCSGDYVIAQTYACVSGQCVNGKTEVTDSCIHGCAAGKCVQDNNDQCAKNSDCPSGYVCGLSGTTMVCFLDPCDDNNFCTVDDLVIHGGCGHVPNLGASCDDGNSATSNDKCNSSGQCGGTSVPSCIVGADCDDADPATSNDEYDGDCKCAGSVLQNPPSPTAIKIRIECPGPCQPYLWHTDVNDQAGDIKIPNSGDALVTLASTYEFELEWYQICNQIDEYDMFGNEQGKIEAFEMWARDLAHTDGNNNYAWYGDSGSPSLNQIVVKLNGVVVNDSFLHKPSNIVDGKKKLSDNPNKIVPLGNKGICQ